MDEEVLLAIKNLFEDEKKKYKEDVQKWINTIIQKETLGNIFPNCGLVSIKNTQTEFITKDRLLISDNILDYFHPLIESIFPSIDLISISQDFKYTTLNFFGELNELLLYFSLDDLLIILKNKPKFILKIGLEEKEVFYKWPFEEIKLKELFRGIFFPESFYFLRISLPKITNKINFSLIIQEKCSNIKIGIFPVEGIYEDVLYTNHKQILLPENTLLVKKISTDKKDCCFNYLNENLLEITDPDENMKIEVMKISNIGNSIKFTNGSSFLSWFFKVYKKPIITDFASAIKYLYPKQSIKDFMNWFQLFFDFEIINFQESYNLKQIKVSFNHCSRLIPKLVEESYVEISKSNPIIFLVIKSYLRNFNLSPIFKIGDYYV